MRRLLLLAATAAACGSSPAKVTLRERPPGGLVAIDPGTSRPELLSATACGRCHPGELAEWRASRHAQAWVNGIFQREYRGDARTWCVNCHAPLAPQVAQVHAGGGALADEGVGCAACHLRAGRIVSGARAGRSPHDTVVVAGFGGASMCAGCHEFGFPIIDDDGEVRRLTEHPMQATVSQFAAGPFAHAEDGCRSCHAAGEHGHRYPGGHDPGMLSHALTISLCRDGGAAVLTLENSGAGHHVPTGDVHRHITVRAWRSNAPERLFEAFIGRRFEPLEDGGKQTIWDSTLPPGGRQAARIVAADLGDGGAIHFEVRYTYTPDENPRRGHDPGEPVSRVVYERSAALEELASCTP